MCIPTLERYGLYDATQKNYSWINEELERQEFPKRYRFGAFGPMTDMANKPLTLGSGMKYLLKYLKGKRMDDGYYYEVQLAKSLSNLGHEVLIEPRR